VRAEGVAIEEADILSAIRERMGARPAPRRIYFLDELPRTDTGKVRRSELPRLLGLDQPAAAIAARATPPERSPFSPLEAALGGLWSTVLQLGTIDRNDDFFLLGGDSLRGARLLASVKVVFGIELPLRALFTEAATVAGMARTIEAARAR